jgi:hypothetical protein
MSIAIYKFIKAMKWEHKGSTIELFLVGIHHPNYPDKIWPLAKADWKVIIDGEENYGTRTGDRDEVLADQKAYIDWLIAGADVNQLF